MHSGDLNLSIRQIIQKYNLFDNRKRAKSFGQHFLCDESLLDKIVLCALPFDDSDIIEIGPGPCGLTRSILKHSKEKNKLFCVEKDENLKDLHNGIAPYFENLKFIYQDALKISPQAISQNETIIISNLPYNVGTQLFLNWLHNLKNIRHMVLMFQKEVAMRICAKVNTKEYGRLSIISQLTCSTEKLFDVSSRAFFPPPKVDSTVIRITPKPDAPNDLRDLERLTAICFQQRRKSIFSILKKYDGTEEALRSCGIEKLARPENISPEQFLELSREIKL